MNVNEKVRQVKGGVGGIYVYLFIEFDKTQKIYVNYAGVFVNSSTQTQGRFENDYFLSSAYHFTTTNNQQQTNTDQNLGPRSDIISYPYMTHPIYNYFRLVSKILAEMQKIIENQLALIKSASYIAEE